MKLYKIFNRMLVKNNAIIVVVLPIISCLSCKKLVEVDAPITSMNAGNVYVNDATAISVLTDIYAEFSAQNQGVTSESLTTLSWFAALSADELTLYSLNFTQFAEYYKNQLTSVSVPSFWNATYPVIFVANSALEGLTRSNSLTPSVKQQLIGEAKFIRAFCYFYLLSIYGDVPLVLTTDYKKNARLARTSKSDVYQQIVADLKDAQNLLNSSYLKADLVTPYAAGSEERIRPTKWAATALLSRAYIFNNDYTNAEIEASKVINNVTLYDTVPLNRVFLKNSKETIWQLQPVGTGTNANTGEGKIFILPSTGPANDVVNPVYLSNTLIASFVGNDQRKSNWIKSVTVNGSTYYYAYKYKVGNVNFATSEYLMVLRLAEQYLIRAEARAQLNDFSGSLKDLNMIRTRAGLNSITTSDKSSILNEIMQERRVELFTEWGHRWFDLQRTNNIDAVMTPVAREKGGTWNSYRALFPIPQSEIDMNSNLDQNTGY